MPFFTGVHTHRHGADAYVFEATTFDTDAFAEWLGETYEPNREDEYLEVRETTIINAE